MSLLPYLLFLFIYTLSLQSAPAASRYIVPRAEGQDDCLPNGCDKSSYPQEVIDLIDGRDVDLDASFYNQDDDALLCSRALNNTCNSLARAWQDSMGNIIPWSRLPNTRAKMAFWTHMTAVGTELKSTMINYASKGVSRLTETSSDQMARFNDYYNVGTPKNYYEILVKYMAKSINKYLRQAGIADIDFDEGFKTWEYLSKTPAEEPSANIQSVITVSINPQKGMIVSSWSFADRDHNPPDQKAYSSTLTWGAWERAAHEEGVDPNTLIYHIRHQVSRPLAANIMAIAHTLYPEVIDTEEVDPWFENHEYAAVAGRGRWTPDHPAYAALLAIPNIKVIVNMIADFNDKMHNPFIAAIHTWPPLTPGTFNGIPDSIRREGEILIEYGPFRAEYDDATSPIETA